MTSVNKTLGLRFFPSRVAKRVSERAGGAVGLDLGRHDAGSRARPQPIATRRTAGEWQTPVWLTRMRGRVLVLCGLFWVVNCSMNVRVDVAFARSAGPGWAIRSFASPTDFSNKLGATGNGYFVTATNVGSEASSGTLTISDTLPDGAVVASERIEETLAPVRAEAYNPANPGGGEEGERLSCQEATRSVECSYGGGVQPGGVILLHVEVELVSPPRTFLGVNRAEISEDGGGGASSAVTEAAETLPTPVNGKTAGFGVQQFSVGVFGPDGERDVQAGSHPVTISSAIAYNSHIDLQGAAGSAPLPYDPIAEPKVQDVDLPMGFAADVLSAPRCTAAELAAEGCPADTRVGVVGIDKAHGVSLNDFPYLYNIVPEAGEPAQFGFVFLSSVFMLRARALPTASGYVLSVALPASPRSELVKVHEASVTFWGDPALVDGETVGEAFASNPVSCGSEPLTAKLEMDSWVAPGDWQSAESAMYQGPGGTGVTGCGALQFNPTINVTPETTEADTPSGYEIDLRVPQASNFEGDLATSDLKNAVVSFPAGVSIDPSAANGLVACQASGPQGIELGNHDQVDADRLAEEGVIQEGEERGYEGDEDGLVHAAAGHCPFASQIGEVEVATPLLETPLTGYLYVAAPGCGGAGQNPCTPRSAEDGELFGVYLEAAGSGVILKLHGQASVNPQTGQLTTTFTEAPELPFSELQVRLNGGQRAPLANPQSCGPFTLTSDLTPWSTPFTPDATPFATYQVSGCTGAFSPAFNAGTTATAGGAFSSFALILSRHDGEGDLSGLTVNMPPGLLGQVAGFEECPSSAASSGSCGVVAPGSRVGSVEAAVGAGSDPFWQVGSAYLTGPYNGGPFGLSVVVPAVAGPYNLGDIVVRASIRINPVTAAVSVVSDAFPQTVDGVPLRVQTIDVMVGEGDNFTFNPTSCAEQAVTGTVSSAQGASVGVSAPFAASGCAALPFKPSLSAATVGKASKAHGASLDTKLSLPAPAPGSGMVGADANIASLKVELPRQLPARNTTLQKACLAAVFKTNPATCPSASDVGSVVLKTPLLASPLVGPAYLVSFGGQQFPEMVMILQAEGVKIEVTGSIYVSKAGITSVTVESVPDAPFTSFELKTPTGPFSVLTSYVPAKDEFDLCGRSLSMPTEINAQNGLTFKQNTKIAITGCGKPKKDKDAKNARHAKNAEHRGRPVTGEKRNGR
jgi:hypothetical protein